MPLSDTKKKIFNGLLSSSIDNRETLERHAVKFQRARVVLLSRGIALIPITDDLHDEIGNGEEPEMFYKLSPPLELWAQHISMDAPVAYIEAKFFGRVGGQIAVAWASGSTGIGPVHEEDAINQALRFLGVQADKMHDEFNTVGLERQRNTHDWVTDNN
jgi:hypothetical protein